MPKRNICFLSLLALSFLFAGCSDETQPETTPLVYEEQEPDITQEAETDNTHINTDVSALSIDDGANPFENIIIAAHWQYEVFELYRGAAKEEFSSTLTYTTSAKYADRLLTHFEIVFPQLTENLSIAERFNSYYFDRLHELRAQEEEIFNSVINADYIGNWGQPVTYNQTVLYAYTWGNIYSVIIDETVLLNRMSSNPFCDNFDLNTGLRLSLDDVFTVGYDIYSRRIISSTQKLDIEDQPLLMPQFEDASESIPMPAIADNFLLTPHGLALIYRQGEIASNSAGAVILIVDYDSISDILAIDALVA